MAQAKYSASEILDAVISVVNMARRTSEIMAQHGNGIEILQFGSTIQHDGPYGDLDLYIKFHGNVSEQSRHEIERGFAASHLAVSLSDADPRLRKWPYRVLFAGGEIAQDG